MTRKSPLTFEELTTPEPDLDAPKGSGNPGPAQKVTSPPNGSDAGKNGPADEARNDCEIDLAVRREIAEELERELHGTEIDWIYESKGICKCPNAASHSGSSRTECVVWIDGTFDLGNSDQWPTKKCSHNHCQDHPLIKQFNQELRSRIRRAEGREDRSTPSAYLASLYPELADKYGEPINGVWEQRNKDHQSVWKPIGLNERFFASLLIREGNDKDPAVWDIEEGICLRYKPGLGFYALIKPEALHEPLDHMLLEIARKCPGPNIDTKPLEFKMRSTRALTPIITKASGLACVSSDIWEWPPSRIPVRNGILDIQRRTLTAHSPDNYFRGVVAVDYVPGKDCPTWNGLMNRRVKSDDADLLQRLTGLVLLGRNDAQVMTLLYGAAGSSKGTIVRVIIGLIGPENTGTLRTSNLDGRFEMARHRHKLLLYGADVDDDFLNNQGAALLKAITGEDAISPEYKNSNVTPAATPIRASIIMTANTRLRIRFRDDKEAWRRRLIPIAFEDEVPEDERVPGFSRKLLDTEGPGILNWALEGARRVLADGSKVLLNDRQKGIRNALLDESESSVAFAREAVLRDPRGRLYASRAYEAYVPFCVQRGWAPETPQRFWTELKPALVRLYGITQATDLPGADGNVRGWRGLRLRCEPATTEEDAEY